MKQTPRSIGPGRWDDSRDFLSFEFLRGIILRGNVGGKRRRKRREKRRRRDTIGFLANSPFSYRSLARQKTSRRGRVSSHENCVVAVLELERITGVAELNEGCRRARLLRDRCCHGDTNPVLRQFTISTRALHRSLRPPGKARSISANAKSRFNGHFVSGQERILAPSPNSFLLSNSFFFPGKKSAQSLQSRSNGNGRSDPKQTCAFRDFVLDKDFYLCH